METSSTNVPTQVLQFRLDGEYFAFDVLRTREVLTLVKVTPLPNSLEYLSGVINLRGGVIPVVDLRRKFGFSASESTPDTSIVIVETSTEDRTSVVGAIVDAVSGVVIFEPKDLDPPPKFGMHLKSNLIRAIAKHADRFTVILDTTQVFSESELDQMMGKVEEGGSSDLTTS